MEILNTTEAVKIISERTHQPMTVRTLTYHCEKKHIIATKKGGHWLIYRKNLDKFVRHHPGKAPKNQKVP